MTDTNVRASRVRVPRSRGAVGGVLLVLGGLWAGLVPFVGPYGNLAFTPDPNATWKWTAARGWLEVLPGGVAVVGGLLLVSSTNRLLASLGGVLGVAAGAWLVIAPTMAEPLDLALGTPDPNQTTAIRVAEQLSFFFGIGAAIVLVAGLALGRLSVLSMRDVQVAERRAALEAEQDAEEARFAEEQRLFHQHRAELERSGDSGAAGAAGGWAGAERPAERTAEFRRPEDAYGNPRDDRDPRDSRDDAGSAAGSAAGSVAAHDADRADRAADTAFVRPAERATDAADDRPSDAPAAGGSSVSGDIAGSDDPDESGGAHRTERLRQADERFAAERARIAAEQEHEPAHAESPDSGQQQRSYPPFYGNQS